MLRRLEAAGAALTPSSQSPSSRQTSLFRPEAGCPSPLPQTDFAAAVRASIPDRPCLRCHRRLNRCTETSPCLVLAAGLAAVTWQKKRRPRAHCASHIYWRTAAPWRVTAAICCSSGRRPPLGLAASRHLKWHKHSHSGPGLGQRECTCSLCS